MHIVVVVVGGGGDGGDGSYFGPQWAIANSHSEYYKHLRLWTHVAALSFTLHSLLFLAVTPLVPYC